MGSILTAVKGQGLDVNSVAGPTSYNTGGFTIPTDLGRVDEATLQIDNSSFETRVDSIASNNQIAAQVFSQGSGTEASQDSDFSGDTVTYQAYRL